MSVDQFKKALDTKDADALTDHQAADAYHNLAGFMGVLLRINERTGLVTMGNTQETGVRHAD